MASVGQGAEQGVDGTKSADTSRIEIPLHVKEEVAVRLRRGKLEGSAVGALEFFALVRVVGRPIAEAGPTARGPPRNDDRTGRPEFDMASRPPK